MLPSQAAGRSSFERLDGGTDGAVDAEQQPAHTTIATGPADANGRALPSEATGAAIATVADQDPMTGRRSSSYQLRRRNYERDRAPPRASGRAAKGIPTGVLHRGFRGLEQPDLSRAAVDLDEGSRR